MAEAATQDFVPAAVGGAGNRADVAGVTGRPGVAEDSKARVAEAAVTDAATTAASCTSVGSKAGRGDSEDKNDGGTRRSGRKFSRLRSAAFSLANGVTRMHSQLRPATAGSAAATSEKALLASAECGGASAAASPPILPTTLRMGGPSGPSSSASSAATAEHLSEHASAGGHSTLSTSRNNTAQLPSNSSAVDTDQSPYRLLAKVDESNEAEAQQQQQGGVSGGVLPPAVNVNAVAQETAAGDAEVHEEQHPAAENASPATTATRASVMSTDLGGFYRKLLGEDWEEQLKELNEESNRLLDTEDADVAAGTAAPPGLGGAAAQGDELQLPDTYQGKMRQRIRRRDISDRPRDISDQVADDLHFGQDEEPLITPEDIAVIREQAWIPAGEGLPHISEMELGYHRAWDVGKKGCLAVKVDGLWDSAVKGNKMRFFVMDGTDPESFLSFYSKSDLHAARGLQSERLGTLTAWDMRDGYWNYPKKKIFVKRTDVKKKDCILEGFTAEFYDAMLLCIWEMCVQAATEQLKHQRRRERGRRRQSLALGLTGGSSDRRRSQTPVGDTRRVSASLLTYKNVPRGVIGGRGGGGLQLKKASAAASEERAVAQHREVMRQLIREGRMLLARPICSRKGVGPRRHVGRAGGGLRARCDRRKAMQATPQPPAEDRQADAGKEAAFGRTAGHAAAREEEEAARTVPATAGSRVCDAADGKTAERRGAGGMGATGVAWRAAAAEAGRSAATTALGVMSKGWPAEAASATTYEAEYEEEEGRGRGGGRDEHLRLSARERVVEDGRGLSEMHKQQGGSRGSVLEATGRTGATAGEEGCRREKAAAAPHANSDFVEELEVSAAATKTGRGGRGSMGGAAGDSGQRQGDAGTSVGSRGGDWEAGSLAARRQANRDEADLVQRQEETEAAGTKEQAAAPFFAASTAQRGGQTGSGQTGGTRATIAAERHTRARRSGTVEEETHVWHYNSNRSISEAMVECRKLYRNDSTGVDGSVQKSAAAAAGGGGAAATLGRLLPWMRLGGGVTKKEKETGAQGKEKGAAGGDEQATVIAAEGGRSAASRSDEEERKTGRNTSRADHPGFNRAVREVMVADGVQWTAPGKSAAEPAGRRAAASPQFSKYEQQNRLPDGGHLRVDTPMMSPEFLSPRDSEPTNPMFG